MKTSRPLALAACWLLLAPFAAALLDQRTVPLTDKEVDDYLIQLQQRVPEAVSRATPMEHRGFVVHDGPLGPGARVVRGFDEGYVSADIGQNSRYTNASLQDAPGTVKSQDPIRHAAQNWVGQAVAPSAMKVEGDAVVVRSPSKSVSRDFSGEFAAIMRLMGEGKAGIAKTLAAHYRNKFRGPHPIQDVYTLLEEAGKKSRGGLPSMGAIQFEMLRDDVRLKINGRHVDHAGPSTFLTNDTEVDVEVLDPASKKAVKFAVNVTPQAQTTVKVYDRLKAVSSNGKRVDASPLSASVFCLEGEYDRAASFKAPDSRVLITLRAPQNVTFRWRVVRNGRIAYGSPNHLTEDGPRYVKLRFMPGETFHIEIDCLAGNGRFEIAVVKDPE